MSLSEEDHKYVARASEAAIRIGLLAALVVLCFEIVRPFAVPVVWGVIIAGATAPGSASLSALVTNEERRSMKRSVA